MMNSTDIAQVIPLDKEITVFYESVFIIEMDLEGNIVQAKILEE